MTEPPTGLDEAIEAAAIANYGSNGNWTLRSEEGREAARDLVRLTVEAAYPVIAAAVRAAERVPGCCSTCKGTGVDNAGYETGGKCSDCYGTGHCHLLCDGPTP